MELAQALSLAGLVLGTIGYAIVVRRRVQLRRDADASGDAGLRGLVRVFMAPDRSAYLPE